MRMQWRVIPVRNSLNFRVFVVGHAFSTKGNATGTSFFDNCWLVRVNIVVELVVS